MQQTDAMEHRASRTGSDVVAVGTDAGMLCVWCPVSFAGVTGYDSWELLVSERLADAVIAGELVPINIESDGAFGVRVSLDPDGLSARERAYALVTSEPYLLVVTDEQACLSGIESVGDPAWAALRIPLADGCYQVRSTIVAWDDEPGSRGPDGRPTADALADFVVEILPHQEGTTYRTKIVTFDTPG